MKKWKLAVLTLLLALLTACGEGNSINSEGSSSVPITKQAKSEPSIEPTSVTSQHTNSATVGDFKLDIVSDKAVYDEGDTISIDATLTYIGDEKDITIGHAMYPVGFNLYEKKRDIYIYGAMAEPYIETTLQKDVPVQYNLNGLGGYSELTNKAEIKFNEAAMSMKLLKGSMCSTQLHHFKSLLMTQKKIQHLLNLKLFYQ